MDHGHVAACNVEGAQVVIGSIGGVQILVPVIRSILTMGNTINTTIEKSLAKGKDALDSIVLFSLLPDLVYLLSSFIRGHKENSREMLRCGAVDVLEKFLFDGLGKGTVSKVSLVRIVCMIPNLAQFWVQSLLVFQSSSRHYVGLETAIFSKLIFNIQLWFRCLSGDGGGVAQISAILPVLSPIVRKAPEKVRDCVGVSEMIWFMRDVVELQVRSSCIVLSVLRLFSALTFSTNCRLDGCYSDPKLESFSSGPYEAKQPTIGTDT
jgi:hypothetical protein